MKYLTVILILLASIGYSQGTKSVLGSFTKKPYAVPLGNPTTGKIDSSWLPPITAAPSDSARAAFKSDTSKVAYWATSLRGAVDTTRAAYKSDTSKASYYATSLRTPPDSSRASYYATSLRTIPDSARAAYYATSLRTPPDSSRAAYYATSLRIPRLYGWYTNGGSFVTDTLRFLKPASMVVTQSGSTLSLYPDTSAGKIATKSDTVAHHTWDVATFAPLLSPSLTTPTLGAATGTSLNLGAGALDSALTMGTKGIHARFAYVDSNLTVGKAIVHSAKSGGIVAFSGTNGRVAVYIQGATSSDIYVVTPVSAAGTAAPTLANVCFALAKTDSLIIVRGANGTGLTGMSVWWYRMQ